MRESPADQLLAAALTHVPFDGWSEASFKAAVAETGLDPVVARGLFPRGALDLAVAFHRQGDAAMTARLAQEDLAEMRIRDRVAFAIRARIEAVDDKELVQRGTVLFALPQNVPEGAKLIWGTADQIWTALGDTSRDVNWYSKRATLSAVYSSVILYWLGDETPDHAPSWEFLDRRIDNVMQIEKTKATLRKAPFLGPLVQGAERVLSRIDAPGARDDLPGSVSR